MAKQASSIKEVEKVKKILESNSQELEDTLRKLNLHIQVIPEQETKMPY